MNVRTPEAGDGRFSDRQSAARFLPPADNRPHLARDRAVAAQRINKLEVIRIITPPTDGDASTPVYDIQSRRNALGVVPTCFLNTVAKCCEEEKPQANAISVIVSWLEVSRLFARSTRWRNTNCHGEYPVATRKPEVTSLADPPAAWLKSDTLRSSAR